MSDRSRQPDVIATRFVLVAALTVFDAGMTTLMIGIFGAVELNPLVAAGIEEFGIVVAMTLRAAIGVAGAGLLALFAAHPGNRWGSGPLVLAAVPLTLLAFWHIAQMLYYFA